ncbi:hypothetical protein FJR04_00655 [Anabaena sp. UHCC 0204]|nr:hypothetical protein [Anabaena sp. UHCC 0204]
MKVRPETLSDYLSITEVNIKAFGIENEAKLIEKIRSSPGYIPKLSLVAEIDNQIVGYMEDVFMVKILANYQDKYQGKIVYPPAFNEV